ncbi:MAG: prolyl aminopeptidase [Methylophilaceae bacterium]|nr:prolyl aminopeptidase [Methylophilaceae bacterium]
MFSQTFQLYPEIEPYQSGWLEVSPIHRVYFEQCGNPEGQPVVFLHGGPGSGCNTAQRRFFDPEHYRIVLFDQRGCGRSMPQGSVAENTTEHLVADIEHLRDTLGIKSWLVFGGSWGSTLALAYALAHPSHVTGLILRGIFLSQKSELNWFLKDVKQFHPEAWQNLSSFLKPKERKNMVNAYVKRIFSDDPATNIPAAINWNAYETSIMTLLPERTKNTSAGNDIQLARARVQLHYLRHECFVGHRDLLDEVKTLAHITTVIIQGRYDMVCPPLTAWQLKLAMPHAIFHMVPDAGHSAMEIGTRSALIAATEQFKCAPDSDLKTRHIQIE